MYLDGLWCLNQFASVKNSEHTHMDALDRLLIINFFDYTILHSGVFENQTLQES